MNLHKLCMLSELEDPGSRGFSLMLETGPLDLFVVCSEGEYRAWLNSCPHRGTPLEWMPDDFLDDEGKHIVCATHGAFFDIKSGACLMGPCSGQGLKPLRLTVRDEVLFLETDQS